MTVDLVNHPPHYTNDPSGVECIEITRHLNFNVGNAYKYVFRVGQKDVAIQEIEKAIWYLEDEIENGYDNVWNLPSNEVLIKMGRVIESRDGLLRTFFGSIYNLYLYQGTDPKMFEQAKNALVEYRANLVAMT